MVNYDLIKAERENFPLLKHTAYFLTSSTGLIPKYIFEAVNQYQTARYLQGGDTLWDGMSTTQMMEKAKENLAKMLGGSKENIIFGENSSQLLNLFVRGIPMQADDNVLISENAFLSTRFAWQSRACDDGICIREIPAKDGVISCEQIAEAMDENTKVVSLSFVESSTGFRYDLEAIGRLCRERNVLLCIDGVQGIGAMPIDIKKMNIDFVVCNNYKWMMGYCGTGFAHIGPNLLESVKPQGAGWMSDACRHDVTRKQLEYRSDAGRFEMGYPNVAGICALSLAAEKYNRLGAEHIEAYIMELRRYLLEKVEKMQDVNPAYDFSEAHGSQIIYLHVAGRCRHVPEEMAARDIAVESTYLKAKDCLRLRVAIHYFNNKEDIDRLLQVIEGR